MKIGVLGTGMVGQSLARKLAELGHEVMMGSRAARNLKAAEFVKETGPNASAGIFSEAAAFGELIVLAVNGAVALEALSAAGEANLAGKVLIDITNPLDFSNGMPPSLVPELSNTNSLGETIQKTYPNSRVVKALNTMNSALMVDPSRLIEPGDVFLCGNSNDAKAQVSTILKEFGWPHPIDLGDITAARALEQSLPLWLRLWGVFGTTDFNFKIVRG
jgi:hypothetical protein